MNNIFKRKNTGTQTAIAVSAPHKAPKKINTSFLRMSLQEQIIFAKRLAMLIKAGVPILSGLEMLGKHNKSRSVKKIFNMIITDVENGQFLSTSLLQFRKIFGAFAINIIQVGEVSGNLHENLNYLAEELGKKQALRRKLINALVYPALIVCATIGIVVLLTVFLFPKILPIFNSFEAELPWTTKVLIFMSAVMTHYGLYIFGAAILLVIAMIFLLRVRKIKLFFHIVLLRLPILGRVYQGYYLTNICRTFGILLKSSVPIVKAAQITSQTADNLAYEIQLNQLAEAVSKGDKVSTYMEKNLKMFPPLLVQMIAVGESAGNLTDTLGYLAETYEKDVDDLTKNLSTALEPILMILMGGLVGFIAISIISPIYEITQHLKP